MADQVAVVLPRLRVAPYAGAVLAAWCLVMGGSLALQVHHQRSTMLEIARSQAMASYEKDVLYRRWAAKHGGVYVLVTAETPPNPYLTNVVERDLVTPSGRQLTLINPAYMTRQVHELGAKDFAMKGHITSLKPIRAENAPDEWERRALQTFQHGATEVTELVHADGQDQLRFMRLMITEESCLKCHAAQGYKVGQVRGGISVTQSMAALHPVYQDAIRMLVLAHLGIWLVGVVAIVLGGRSLQRRIRAQAEARTELETMRERLRQAEKMEAIGQLAGGVAHDFNNQLGGIIGFAEMLAEYQQEPLAKRYADGILKAALRASALTRQLLAFSRRGSFQSVTTDTHAILQEVVELLQRSIDKRIDVKLQLAAAPSTVLADTAQLQNAFLNLGLNARDAMPDGGVLVFATRLATIASPQPEEELAPGQYVQISVTDTGCGMSAETKRRLFEPFYTTKEIGKGTGLGLASVYGTVKNHGGAIRVESEVGRGTTFHIYLPLYEGGVAVAPPGAAALPTGHGKKIMLVDDEPVILAPGEAMLRTLGYEVAAYRDPSAALAAYQQAWCRIDLVILDMMMPKMSGRELYLALRAVNPNVKVLLASGYSEDGEAHALMELGVRAFVQKPYRRAELAQMIAVALRGAS
jgi:signal transduction histidine kinase/ActR/RegA family two-component response regulator